MLKRGSVAIVGAAESDIGSVAADMSVIDLMAQRWMAFSARPPRRGLRPCRSRNI